MVLLVACGGKPVPGVVGMNPQEAIDAIHAAGIDHTKSHGGIGAEEGTGFVVCRTEPKAGDTGGKVDIYSRQDCKPKSAAAKTDVKQAKKEKSSDSSSGSDLDEARYIRDLRREVRANCKYSDADSMCAIALKLKYDDHLDPLDGSLAVTAPMNLYKEEAADVAGIVMGMSFGLDEGGLCKIDVRQPDGRRVVEHESDARACL
jgi:hypothetical protein